MTIGFSKLETIIYERDYNEWLTLYGHKVETPYSYRKKRAIAVLEGKDPNKLYPINIFKQQAYLNTLTNEGQTK